MAHDEIEGWVFVDNVWWRSPMPPHIAKRIAKRQVARVLLDAEGDPRDRCPPAGPFCSACRRAQMAVVEHPCRVCGRPTTILRATCVSCGMRTRWQ